MIQSLPGQSGKNNSFNMMRVIIIFKSTRLASIPSGRVPNISQYTDQASTISQKPPAKPEALKCEPLKAD
jgi:hypothetical protein